MSALSFWSIGNTGRIDRPRAPPLHEPEAQAPVYPSLALS